MQNYKQYSGLAYLSKNTGNSKSVLSKGNRVCLPALQKIINLLQESEEAYFPKYQTIPLMIQGVI